MSQRIIKRAGITPWPKLWQNLRATRATELADRFPGHVAAAWCGHAEQVALDHYWTITEDHFAAAVQPGDHAEPPCTQSGAAHGGKQLHMAPAPAITALPGGESRREWARGDTELVKALEFASRRVLVEKMMELLKEEQV